MKVRFKQGNGVCYEVLQKEQVVMFDAILNKLCPCIKVETLGWVPGQLMEPAREGDVDTLEVLVQAILRG